MVGSHRRLVVAAVCSLLLLRHNGGGGALAQRGGGGDDDDGGNRNDDDDDDGSDVSTLSPTGAPASGDDSSEYPDCPGYASHIKDGYCDRDLNTASCGWDGGDCCACTCGEGLDSADELPHPCGQLGDGYDCQDPDVPDDCGVTPSPAASFGYPDCDGFMYNLQDSHCDDDLNNARCGWDGGDCCRCTCREYGYHYYGYAYGYNSCGSSGYDCKDPEAPEDCSTDSPTPSPAAASDYPGCGGYIAGIGDGQCHSNNNNEECAWDGGDCCACECDALSCGYFEFDCLDPTASTACATPNPSYTSYISSLYASYNDTGCSWSDDGMCDPSHNTDECEWDGGDCCSCDCVESVFKCGVSGFNCLDPSSTCFGSSASASSSVTDYFDDDGDVTATSGGYHDDDVTSNSPGYGSTVGENGDRGFSSSGDSAVAVGVQDIAGGSSGSSLSDLEIGGVFVLAVSAFLLFGCAALAVCGFLRPRMFCGSGGKASASAAGPAAGAAAAGAAGDRASSRHRRSRSFSRVQHGPPTPRAEAEAAAAEDGVVATALRNSATAAPTDDAEGLAQVDEQSAMEAGGVYAQESKGTDEAELGRAFYGTGGTGASQAGSAEGGDGGAAAGDGKEGTSEMAREDENDGGTSAVAGAGKVDHAAAEKGEEHAIEGDAVEESGAGEEAEGGTVEAGAGEKNSYGDRAVESGEEEKPTEQNSSAVEQEAGEEKETTAADKPEADGAAAGAKGSSDPPGED